MADLESGKLGLFFAEDLLKQPGYLYWFIVAFTLDYERTEVASYSSVTDYDVEKCVSLINSFNIYLEICWVDLWALGLFFPFFLWSFIRSVFSEDGSFDNLDWMAFASIFWAYWVKNSSPLPWFLDLMYFSFFPLNILLSGVYTMNRQGLLV